MAEPTTTDEPVVSAGAEEALPVVDDVVSADAPVVDEPSEVVTGADDDSAAPVDDKLQSFAKGQGIDDISELSERELKLLKVAKDNQAEYQRNRQKASELEKTVVTASDAEAEASAEATGQDPELMKRLQRVEVKEAVRDFWNTDGVDKSFEPAMIEIVQQKPYLAGDLETLYAAAVMKSGGVAAVKSQGARDALTNLAHKQQAAVPTGSATTTATPRKKPFAELSIAEMEKELGTFRQ